MRGAGPETHIVVAAAGGGSQRILATRKSPLAFSFFAPDWSPDGKVVAASAIDRSNGSRVHRSSPDGRRQQPRALHDRQSHRPCPLAARRIGTAGGRLGSAGASHANSAVSREGDLAHRVPRRSSRTTDVRSGRPRPLLPGRRGERQRGRERHQFARVGPLDCAGRPPGRAQAGHLGPSRDHASQLVTGQRHDRVSRSERTSECRPQGRPGIQPAVARWSQGGGRRLRLRRRPLRRLSSSPGKQHLARHAQRRWRGQTHQRLYRLESRVFS